MSEPSAWAKGQWADLKNQPGTLKEAVILALDAAWRAGAAAMHQLLIDVVDDPTLAAEVRQLPRPEPGEER